VEHDPLEFTSQCGEIESTLLAGQAGYTFFKANTGTAREEDENTQEKKTL
jgi:hypothetical protein